MRAIIALGVTCSYDEFHDRSLVGGEPINQWAGELSDAVIAIVRQMIVDHFGFDPGKDNTNDAATELCLENRFAKVVWTLAAHGHGPEKIKETLAAHPNGIASKYINRLGQEIERCYRKWLIAKVRQPAKEGEQPIWPDLTDKGQPKQAARRRCVSAKRPSGDIFGKFRKWSEQPEQAGTRNTKGSPCSGTDTERWNTEAIVIAVMFRAFRGVPAFSSF